MRNRGRKKGALTVDPSPVLPRLGIDSPGPASGAFRKAAGGKLPACDALWSRARERRSVPLPGTAGTRVVTVGPRAGAGGARPPASRTGGGRKLPPATGRRHARGARYEFASPGRTRTGFAQYSFLRLRARMLVAPPGYVPLAA